MTNTEIEKIISAALAQAYKHSSPDILSDVAAATVLYELRSRNLLIADLNEPEVRDLIIDIIEKCINNPLGTKRTLQSMVRSALVIKGCLAEEKE